jgi:hypothetical protein
MPTADRDPDAGNQWQSYHKGWKAGAASKAMDPVFLMHDNAKIKAAYEQGYQDARLALNAAMQKAADRYGYRINVLRLCNGLIAEA